MEPREIPIWGISDTEEVSRRNKSFGCETSNPSSASTVLPTILGIRPLDNLHSLSLPRIPHNARPIADCICIDWKPTSFRSILSWLYRNSRNRILHNTQRTERHQLPRDTPNSNRDFMVQACNFLRGFSMGRSGATDKKKRGHKISSSRKQPRKGKHASKRAELYK